MKKYLLPTFLLLLLVVCASACESKKKVEDMSDDEKIHAVVADENDLSPDELKHQHDVRANILKGIQDGNNAEEALQSALQDAKALLDDADTARLDAAQDLWLRQGRGTEINALIQKGMDPKEANAAVSLARAEKIREQLNRAVLIAAPKLYQGYFRAPDGQSLEIYQLDGNVIVVTMRIQNPNTVINAKGTYDGDLKNPVKLTSEKDDTIAFDLQWINATDLELIPAPSATQNPAFALFASTLTARYRRVKKEELDVFSF